MGGRTLLGGGTGVTAGGGAKGGRGCGQDGSVGAVGRVSPGCGDCGERIAGDGAGAVGGGAAVVAGAVGEGGHPAGRSGRCCRRSRGTAIVGPLGKFLDRIGPVGLAKDERQDCHDHEYEPTPKTSLIDSAWLMIRPSALFSGTFGADFRSRSGIWARSFP